MAEQQLATFGGGCFWCTEAIFTRLNGVFKVTNGYAGGTMPEPSYDQVSSGRTGHAEAVQIEFDPSVISYEQLVEVFFLTHDPTTMNRQGADVGEQYRSVIFTHGEDQRKTADTVKARLEAEKVYDDPIVTQIVPADDFYPAETYHQDYYARNPDQPYCQVVINPKVRKLRETFKHLLKPAA